MPFPYNKILVVGNSGAGKSTLARCMAERFSLPLVHLDTLWWLPDWQERPQAEFDALLETELTKPSWVMDGNFRRTFERRLSFADFCIFLDVDTKTCVESVYARARAYRGKSRPDMTQGCPERINDGFVEWIETFSRDVRPQMLAVLQQSNVPYRLFPDRPAAYAWLESFSAE